MTAPVAVTGAAGFIGQALITHLLDSGRSVRALVHTRALPISHPRLDVIRGGLSDQAALARLVEGAGSVLHLAGQVRGRNADDFMPVNADGVDRIAKQALVGMRHPRRFVLVSSLAARAPRLSGYAASKRAGEQRLQQVLQGEDMSWCILRPPAVYGPGDTELLPLFRLMARGVVPLVGTAQARASLVHVTDLCRALTCLLDHDVAGTFELHDGHPGGYGWDEMGRIVERVTARKAGLRLRLPETLLRGVATANLGLAKLTGRLPMLTPGKVNELTHPNWVCDNAHLSRATGWTPSITLQEGLSPLLGGPPPHRTESVSHVR